MRYKQLVFLLSLIVCAYFIAGCATSKDMMRLESKVDNIEKAINDPKALKSEQQAMQKLDTFKDSLDTIKRNQADILMKMDELVSVISMLEGRVGEISYHLANISQKMTSQTNQLEILISGKKPSGEPSGAMTSLSVDPEELYQNAYSDFSKKQYELAIMGFTQLVKEFPNSELADNAQLWIGECYFSQSKYDKAIEEFEKVVQNYPNGDKIPDALMKIAMSQEKLKMFPEAKQTYEEVINRFPTTHFARVAKDRIESLNKSTR